MIDPVSLAVIRGHLEQTHTVALALPVGARVAGPAILEQSDTTIFVDPGLGAEVDRFGNLVVKPDD